MPFHEGELELQRRAGVEGDAARVGRIIRDAVPEVAADFLAEQPMLVVGWRDGEGRVRASLLTGPPGFARAPEPRLVEVDGPLSPSGPVGLLAIHFARRQRMRVNGDAVPRPGGFRLAVAEAYSNCPKYIQRRVPEGLRDLAPGSARESAALTPDQQAFIAAADTFFIASAPHGRNADVSHRGGQPGFVRVDAPDRLSWDDYPGNAMFNTLGNLLLDPESGLLFVDFAGGRTLELAGRTRVIGDAERTVEFRVEKVTDDPAGNPLRWKFVDYSPYNPR